MKTLLAGLLLLGTGSSMACSCVDTDERLIRSISKLQKIDYKDVYIHDFKETYNYVYMLPNAIRGELSRDPMMKCMLSCSYVGVKVSANVEYKKDGQLCSAFLIKPARYASRIKLKNIVCN